MLNIGIGAGIAKDAVAVAQFSRELPGVLREFALNRQEGDEKTIGEDISAFLKEKFPNNANIPGFGG